MKLYYAPQTCSMGIHLLMEEIGQPFERQALSFATQEQRSSGFLAVNRKGKVPTLVTDTDGVVTEFPAVALYLATRFPAACLLPPGDSLALVRAIELMDYAIATVHMRGFSRVFRPDAFSADGDPERVRRTGLGVIDEGLTLFDSELVGRDYLLGAFSIADASLFILEWWASKRLGKVLPENVAAHFVRMLGRPAVQRMLAAEGLAP